ncbi:MAG: Yip1 family protein [Steroidobacteraceae bacterium]
MNKLVQRVINILKTPKTEWPVIAAEPATPGSVYVPYVLLLSAIAPVAMLLVGGSYGFFRLSTGLLLRAAVTQYVVGLVGVALFALVIHLLAPTFGAAKDYTQALKSVAYAGTAAWLAGIGGLLGPGLGTLLMLAGGIYSIYLLYLSLPHTMKAPQEKAVAYTVVAILVCIVVGSLLSVVARAVGVSAAYSPLVQ